MTIAIHFLIFTIMIIVGLISGQPSNTTTLTGLAVYIMPSLGVAMAFILGRAYGIYIGTKD